MNQLGEPCVMQPAVGVCRGQQQNKSFGYASFEYALQVSTTRVVVCLRTTSKALEAVENLLVTTVLSVWFLCLSFSTKNLI